MKYGVLINLIASVLLLTGCFENLPFPFSGGDTDQVVVQPTGPVLPTAEATATPKPALVAISQAEVDQAAQEIVELLNLSAPSSDVRVARHNEGDFSFEIPPGWEVVRLEGDESFLVCRIGADVFGGVSSDHPYLYVRTVPWDGAALQTEDLASMRQSLAGVDLAEKPMSPQLAGLAGIGQFVNGKLGTPGEIIRYRAYLLAVPLPAQGQLVQMIFWGPEDRWQQDAREMALTLETILWEAVGR